MRTKVSASHQSRRHTDTGFQYYLVQRLKHQPKSDGASRGKKPTAASNAVLLIFVAPSGGGMDGHTVASEGVWVRGDCGENSDSSRRRVPPFSAGFQVGDYGLIAAMVVGSGDGTPPGPPTGSPGDGPENASPSRRCLPSSILALPRAP